MKLQNNSLLQFIKYGCVGVLNTFLTIFVILLCKKVMGFNDYVSNVLGYIVGLINSFMWNKKWVFQSHGKVHREAILFLVGFGVCYGIQFLALYLLNSRIGDMEYHIWKHFAFSGYFVATILGNVVYTLCNFIYNKLVTFHKFADEQ